MEQTTLEQAQDLARLIVLHQKEQFDRIIELESEIEYLKANSKPKKPKKLRPRLFPQIMEMEIDSVIFIPDQAARRIGDIIGHYPGKYSVRSFENGVKVVRLA